MGVPIGNRFFGQPNHLFGDIKDVGTLVSAVLANIYVIAGVILLILIIFGGLGIIMGAGQNDPQKVAQGKKAVTMAIAGFLIIFASYWIIQLVELLTGVNILGK